MTTPRVGNTIRSRATLDRRRVVAFVASWGWQGAAVLAYVIVHASWLLLEPTPAAWRESIGNAFFAPVGLVMAAMAWANARDRRLRPRVRRGWALLAGAYLVLWTSTNLWAANDLFLGRDRLGRMVVDTFSAVYPTLLALGVLCFGPAHQTRTARARVSLDFATVGIGAATLVWYFMIRLRYAGAPELDWLVVSNLLTPAGDLIGILAIALVLMRGTDRRSTVALQIMAAGQLVLALGDSVYTPLAMADSYRGGHPVDLLWMLGDALMFAGALYQHRRGGGEHPSFEQAGDRRFARLPYLFIVGGYLPIIAASEGWSRSDRTVLYATVLLTLCVVARQFVALRENVRLDREGRLQEARFRSLVQHSSDTVTVIDANGIVRYQSASAERLLGYPPHHLIGDPLTDLVHP
ncbi:MAG TPA: PAS domain-containing protein, partial [Gemmatimonadaceae bacterium]|nr:PAS domain-containing protein [Gemmatimonadaceae bacterium]